jgi:hypothetical protein
LRPTGMRQRCLVSYQGLFGFSRDFPVTQIVDSKKSGRGEWI